MEYYRWSWPEDLKGSEAYDASVTLFCLQGLVNRSPDKRLYIEMTPASRNWRAKLEKPPSSLASIGWKTLMDAGEVLELGMPYVKCVILWDPSVPATVNVATTMAGIEQGLVLTSARYGELKERLAGLPVLSLCGMFDGKETGSAKNDAYRWAMRRYLSAGLCSREYMCYYTDSLTERDEGKLTYTCQRDFAVWERAFVMDLSPWADESPFLEPEQEKGLDASTMEMLFGEMEKQTQGKKPFELCGFFNFEKYSMYGRNQTSRHGPVQTEWETVWRLSPHGGFQNTVTNDSMNQSFHAQMPMANLKNTRPPKEEKWDPDTLYLSFFMADYDSTWPLYEVLEQIWDDPERGSIPLAWGINPNLSRIYPDLISYFYATATPNDYFTSDASAAGYFNPNRVRESFWPAMAAFQKEYFEKLDLHCAPMILEWEPLSERSLDEFSRFAPDGISTIIEDFHRGVGVGVQPDPFLWKGNMVVDRLWNSVDTSDPERAAGCILDITDSPAALEKNDNLALMRVIWIRPERVCRIVEAFRRLYGQRHPGRKVEIVDIYTYYRLRRQWLRQREAGKAQK